MKVLDVRTVTWALVMVLFSLRGIRSLTGPASPVTAHSGESLTVSCTYNSGFETHRKYWCRGGYWKNCNVVIKTSGRDGETTSGRFSIRDGQSQRTFSVTITAVTREDEDTYFCGVERFLVDDMYVIKVTVLPEKCRKMEILSPNITLFPDQEYYGPGEEVTIGCPGGYEPNVRLIQCVKETNRNRWNVGHVFCSQTNFTMGPSYGMNQTEIQPWDLFVGPTFGLVIPISLKLLGLLSVLLWKGISTLSKKYWDSRQATADLHVTSGPEEHTVYHQDNTLDNKKIFSKKEEKEQLYANLDHYTCVK